MIGWSLGYDDAKGHHGLGLSLAEPPERFTARMYDTHDHEADREVVYARVSPAEPTCPDCGTTLNTNWGHCPDCDEWREI